MTTFLPGDGHHFRPATLAEFNFQLQSKVGYIDTNPSSVPSTVDDAEFSTITTEYSDPYYDITVAGGDESIELTLLDATGSLSGNRVSRVSNGECRVLASHFLLSRLLTLDMSRIGGNVYDELTGWAAGSLAKHISDTTTAWIDGKTSADMPIYTTQNHAAATYVRNPDCWIASRDLTAISPWNSRGGVTRAGTAITPRHVLLATHYPLVAADTIRFVAEDNTVVTRTVSSVANVPNSFAYEHDVQIALLASDLPASITPMKFLPANAADYLPSWETWKIPTIATNQQERAKCQLCKLGMYQSSAYVEFWAAPNLPYSTMYEPTIIGDSGSPYMLAINGTLVLIATATFGSGGAAHHLMLTEIAAALTTLGGGHTLSTVDLSSFTNYAA